jgi:hypothetical protein
MNDACEIRFLPGAARAFRKIGRTNPERVPFIEDAIGSVLENGWILSVRSRLIKVLDQQRHIGEIRDLGSGGYRLFFFWRDEAAARAIFVTAIEKKSQLKGRRVNDFVDAAAALRRRYFAEEGEE